MREFFYILSCFFFFLSTRVYGAHFVDNTTTAPKHVSPFIVGGGQTSNVFPFMASIQIEGDQHYCGGTYLGGRYVLTAAHCLLSIDESDGDWRVWLGSNALSGDPASIEREQGQYYRIVRSHAHPKFTIYPEIEHDVGILELDRDVVGVMPINLATSDVFDNMAAGELLEAIGWGYESEQDRSLPQQLNSVLLPYIGFTECQQAEIYGDLLKPGAMCAGYLEGGKGICDGDSGGPLLYRFDNQVYQVGIGSWSMGCAHANKPSVFMRADFYKPWIDSVINGISINNGQHSVHLESDYLGDHRIEIKNNGIKAISIKQIALLSEQQLTTSADSCAAKVLNVGQKCTINFKFVKATQGISEVVVNTQMLIGTETINLTEQLHYHFLSAVYLQEHVLNNPDYLSLVEMYSGGSYPWVMDTGLAYHDDSSIVSGSIVDSALIDESYDGFESILLMKINSDRVTSISIRQFVRLLSESYGYFEVRHNGQIIEKVSQGLPEFAARTVTLEPGVDRLEFIYSHELPYWLFRNDAERVVLDDLGLEVNNTEPVAQVARPHIKVNNTENFTLDGSPSSDADGDKLRYTWRQVSGETLLAEAFHGARLSLDPPYARDVKEYVFELEVTDGFGGRNATTVTVSAGSITGLIVLLGICFILRLRTRQS